MKYMLDTNICIYLMKKKSKRLVDTLVSKDPRDVCISSITLSELYYGVHNSQAVEKNLNLLETFLIPLQILDFDHEAAKSFGEIKTILRRSGKAVGGSQDLQIATHAISRNLTLVTNDAGFKHIQSLNIEDWT